MRSWVLLFLVVCWLCACSLYRPIRIRNTSSAPITLRYKIQPIDGWKGLMHSYALRPTIGVLDTPFVLATVNTADSVITLTLQPGQEAVLGEGRIGARTQLLPAGAVADPECRRYCMNLYWMRISQNGVEHTYTAEELLQALRKRQIPIALVAEKESG